MNSQEFPPPSESFDNYHSFGSNPPPWQDSAPRFRPPGHYQGTFYNNQFLIYRFLFL